MAKDSPDREKALLLKRAPQWLLRHGIWVVVVLFLLLSALIAIYFGNNLIESPPIFRAQPASLEMATEVKKSVKFMDSYYSYHEAPSRYKVYVLVEPGVSFVPKGIQLVDSKTQSPLGTTRLHRQPQMKCWVGLSYKDDGQGNSIYETDWILNPPFPFNNPFPEIPQLANQAKKQVTLYVETREGVFAINGLEVSKQCAGGIE